MADTAPTWTLQRIENGEWADVISERTIEDARDRHTEHTKADPAGMYRVVRDN